MVPSLISVSVSSCYRYCLQMLLLIPIENPAIACVHAQASVHLLPDHLLALPTPPFFCDVYHNTYNPFPLFYTPPLSTVGFHYEPGC